ncbi:hypothetical protein F4780DRAFT_792369 [Xylariomycetidae sp. FL0641]|nr:hypothetical protein F4780DRAFT_792369 [Xylariomycetidae sp. FL0641]
MASLTKRLPKEALTLCSQRLLKDVKELVERPYPNTKLILHGESMASACLILTPENYPPLHLTIYFDDNHPLCPPLVRMDSDIVHPNVFGDFICATILRSGEEYTPAYTLEGIAIQLLSFFDSENLEQDHGFGSLNLKQYRSHASAYNLETSFACKQCGYRQSAHGTRTSCLSKSAFNTHAEASSSTLSAIQDIPVPRERAQAAEETARRITIDSLPNEILTNIIEHIDEFSDLTNFARAWPRISIVIRDFDIVRQRELQCFCLKKGYRDVKLGVGVAILGNTQISSEFDLLSLDAYRDLGIRRSVHNLPFGFWLPLPISQGHWRRVETQARECLGQVASSLRGGGKSITDVLFTFMNDIVVRLNKVAERTSYHEAQSALCHASEKAIESYFHLFHLLLCLATEDQSIVDTANSQLRNFAAGRRSKTDCPNLGHLLIALLISDVEVTDELTKAIIVEAITRNVVWLLSGKDRHVFDGKPELSYLEGQPVSAYRLDQTFRGSRTSYRLLMFCELFRRTARPSRATPLVQVRDELFARHGAPPRGAAAHLSAEIRRLHRISDFPAFLREMGRAAPPSPQAFTAVLRDCVRASHAAGYSDAAALPRPEALWLRLRVDPGLQVSEDERRAAVPPRIGHRLDFFPRRGRGGAAGGGARRSAGRWR